MVELGCGGPSVDEDVIVCPEWNGMKGEHWNSTKATRARENDGGIL